jgi:hypothetical protein
MPRSDVLAFALFFAAAAMSAIVSRVAFFVFLSLGTGLLIAYFAMGLGKLVIHLAEWGTGPRAGDYEDVTETVAGRVENNAIAMRAADSVLGDPYPGRAKHLRVTYSFHCRRRLRTVEHNDWLRLP